MQAHERPSRYRAALIAIVMGARLASLMSRALARLNGAYKNVERDEYIHVEGVKTGDEIELLATGFNSMVDGLRERDKLRATMGEYMTQSVMDHCDRCPPPTDNRAAHCHPQRRGSIPPRWGSRPPSHAQNANASNHVTQFIGCVSFTPGTSLHAGVCRGALGLWRPHEQGGPRRIHAVSRVSLLAGQLG